MWVGKKSITIRSTKIKKRVGPWATTKAIALQTYGMNEALIQAVDLRPTQRALEVACGTGNGALVAGRCRL